MSETPVAPTKRVRILVAIDTDGKWTSMGSAGSSDAILKDWILLDELNERYVFRWIEADIPLPVELMPTVHEGMVTE